MSLKNTLWALTLSASLALSWCSKTNAENLKSSNVVEETSNIVQATIECKPIYWESRTFEKPEEFKSELDRFFVCVKQNFQKSENYNDNILLHTFIELKKLASIYFPEFYEIIKDIEKIDQVQRLSKNLFDLWYFINWLAEDVEEKFIKITPLNVSNNIWLQRLFWESWVMQNAKIWISDIELDNNWTLGHQIFGSGVIYMSEVKRYYDKYSILTENIDEWSDFYQQDIETAVIQNEAAHSILENHYWVNNLRGNTLSGLDPIFKKYTINDSYAIEWNHFHELVSDTASLSENLSILPSFIKNLVYAIQIDENWELSAKPWPNQAGYILTQNVLLQELLKFDWIEDILKKHILLIKETPISEFEMTEQILATDTTRMILGKINLEDWEQIANRYLEIVRTVVTPETRKLEEVCDSLPNYKLCR